MKSINFTGIFKKNFIVGLDIGTTSVKIAQFERKSGLLMMKLFARKRLQGF
jgi:Tfp pilus assembly PilM family ATPase